MSEKLLKYGGIVVTILGFGLSMLGGRIDEEKQKIEIRNSVKAEITDQLKDLKS